jgi:hypothetical protein
LDRTARFYYTGNSLGWIKRLVQIFYNVQSADVSVSLDCHHQKLPKTTKTKLEVAIELKELMKIFTRMDKESFIGLFDS